jgi:hypothetical protein
LNSISCSEETNFGSQSLAIAPVRKATAHKGNPIATIGMVNSKPNIEATAAISVRTIYIAESFLIKGINVLREFYFISDFEEP